MTQTIKTTAKALLLRAFAHAYNASGRAHKHPPTGQDLVEIINQAGQEVHARPGSALRTIQAELPALFPDEASARGQKSPRPKARRLAA